MNVGSLQRGQRSPVAGSRRRSSAATRAFKASCSCGSATTRFQTGIWLSASNTSATIPTHSSDCRAVGVTSPVYRCQLVHREAT